MHNIVNERIYHTYFYRDAQGNVQEGLSDGMFLWPSIQECFACRVLDDDQKKEMEQWLLETHGASSSKKGKKEPAAPLSRFEAWAPQGPVVWDENEVFLYLQKLYWDKRWPMKMEEVNRHPSLTQMMTESPILLMVLYILIIAVGYFVLSSCLTICAKNRRFKRKI